MAYHLFGIRHHGPGSARSLLNALENLQPDCILIEGPPEADGLLPLALHPEMQVPVALLVYAPDEPQRAVYYPFAEFSPEWQAIRYGLQHGIPLRFMDLPVSLSFARDKAREQEREREQEQATPEALADEAPADESPDDSDPMPASTAPIAPAADETQRAIRRDPLTLLAEAAGYTDSERWWEHMVEERRDSSELFAAINEAMTALRQAVETTAPGEVSAGQGREQLREAYMRKSLRQAQKDGFGNIAVVCGAWHVPALQVLPAAKTDNDLLKGLPKLKTTATWVPWTYERLSNGSGYAAGVTAPGWYAHLWASSALVSSTEAGTPDSAHASTHASGHLMHSAASTRLGVRWLTQVAHTFRAGGLDISSAHVIETVRLAETLAALRGRPLPGLAEMNEAIRSVMLLGDDFPLQLLQKRLLVGEVLGAVPAETPQTPLQADLAQQQKRLRLQPSATDQSLLLDLRKENDLERSDLLRRLQVLGISWGQGGERASGKGTFKESWRLLWQPEFEIRLIEAGFWGNTLENAASAALVQRGQKTASLANLAALVNDALLARLPTAVDGLMLRLQAEAAISSDIQHLMAALPELARLLRYGDVRKTSVQQVDSIVAGMVTRVCIGLPNACSALNEEAAEAMFTQIQGVQDALTLLDVAELTAEWTQVLVYLLDQAGLQGLLAGRCCRLLLQAGVLNEADSARRFGLALSTANEPGQAAAWMDGFLRGSGQLLIYDEDLWALLDQWVAGLSADSFQQLLPVLRRTFATFTAPERRQMGERVKQGQAALPKTHAPMDSTLDTTRAARALPLVAQMLGLEVRHAH